MSDLKFDKPSFVWVVEYKDNGIDPGDSSEVSEMVIFEYETPLTESMVLEEVRHSFTTFAENKDATLVDVGIEVISIKREEC